MELFKPNKDLIVILAARTKATSQPPKVLGVRFAVKDD